MSRDKELDAQILRYHFVEHWGVNTIASQLGIHHSTVDRVLCQAGMPKAERTRRTSIVDAYHPMVIETLPWSSPVINTAGATPDYVMPFDTCLDGPVAADEGHGPDVVFLYTSPAKQKVVFSFDTSQTFFNTYLYAVKTCSDFGASCIAAQDSLVNGGESLILDLEVGETWFVVVDGFFTGSTGQFVLKADTF